MPDNRPNTDPDQLMNALNSPPAGGVSDIQDITDIRLEDLNTPRPPIGEGQSISSVPEGAGIPGPTNPEPERTAVDDLGTVAAGGRRKRTVQDRIDTLTRRYHTAEEEKSVLGQQLRELADVVTRQQQMIMNLRSPAPAQSAPAAPPAAGDANFGGLISGEDQAKPLAPAAQSPIDISKIVEDAIGRYDQKQRQAVAQFNQLRQAHEVSFAQAAEEFPELVDQRTSFRRTFDVVFNKSPLRALPDAPYQIALQVRGMLADEASRAARKTEQKRQATVVVPNPSITDVPNGNRAAYVKEFEKATAAIRAGDNSFETFRKWRVLRAELQQKK